MNYLVSKTILNNETPDTNQLKQWINEAQGKWLILMYHHLFPKDSKETHLLEYHKVKNKYSLYPKNFDEQIQILVHSNYMIAPIAVIGKYIVERNNTKIKFRKCYNRIEINTISELDTTIYNQPLTIKVDLPWKKVLVKGSESEGIFNITNNQLLIDALPGKTIMIIKLR